MAVAILVTATWQDSNIWYYCFFAANIPFILTVGILPIVHYWSIGVEEQFYLFWPWLVKLTHGKTKTLLVISIALCVAWLSCKWGIYLIFGTTTAYRFFSVTRFDCMMMGAVGAILYFTNDTALSFLQNRFIGLVCFILLLFSQPWAGFIPAPIRPQVIAVLSLICVLSQLKRPIINLENRLCDFVGKISYGIYVIHPLLIILLSTLWRDANIQMPRLLSVISIYCIITAITIFIAWISYRFYESPFLRLKNKFSIVHSKNSMDK
jgi:peptidoglycan/LPS O-acetylase OafA/YrhL